MKTSTAPLDIEQSYISQGATLIAGVDEVGRGPLAGPVVACAVIMPNGLTIEGVNDSKKTSLLRRIELALRIKEAAIAYSFGIIDVDMIDEINILQATLLAMQTAVEGLTPTPEIVLVDGMQLPKKLPCRAVGFNKGDSLSHTIAAASILAKVERDEIMLKLHEMYPKYGFDVHKGYGTAKHMTALRELGVCPQHRVSFCGKVIF